MTLVPGTRLGPYEISSPLGAGGMGEVYKARDTRLERTVAIKVLPPHLAASPERRQRFEREAKAISALNHPHICVLHDVGRQDGIDFLVLEYLEGQTLADKLKKGPLPIEQVLRYGTEIVDALDQAHRQGIVHRDLKPANVMLTKSGAKLLDFGLAKLRAPAAPPGTSEASSLATEDEPLTGEGGIVGTCPYMAPEQLQGKDPDARTDIFALGALLYEMTTGRRPFTGDSQASVIAAILGSTPTPVAQVRPLTPAALDHVVARCLAKDPNDRWQNAHDISAELKWISAAGSAAGLAPPPPSGRSRKRHVWTAVAVAAVVSTAVLSLVVVHRRERPQRPLEVRFRIAPPEKTTFSGSMALSPGGERIAFAASAEGTTLLYVQPFNSVTAKEVPGTEGASWPFWSPDGRQLGFVADGKLKTVDFSSGPAQTVCDLRGYFGGATWSPEGVIVFSERAELFRVAPGLGHRRPLGQLTEGEINRYWPQFLPDGRRYLYLSTHLSPEKQGIYVASLDSDDRKRIVASDHNAEYSPSGHLLVVKGGVLTTQAFDLGTLELSGEAFPVADHVGVSRVWAPRAAFSVSANGVLAWRPGSASIMPLTWFDRSGRKLGTVGEPADYSNPALSPDEKSLAVGRVDTQRNTRDLWVFDLRRGNSTRLTFDPGEDFVPAWSPDGTRIAFTSDRKGVRDIYQKLANGSGDDELLLETRDGAKHVEDWSADGRFLLFNYWRGASTPTDLFLLPLGPGADRKPIPFLATDSQEDMGQFSPNGRWIAYRSYRANEPPEVYVQGVSPNGRAGGGKWQVSTAGAAGGREPRWRGDGRELFYLSGSKLMAVEVKTDGASFEAGISRELFDVPMIPEVRRNRYLVTRDGRRFLFNTVKEETTEPIHVVVNWAPSRR